MIGFDGVGEHEERERERDDCGTQKQLQILNFRFSLEDGLKNKT